MKTSGLKGLLIFSYYRLSRSVALILLLSLGLGILMLLFPNAITNLAFPMMIAGGPSYIVLTKAGGIAKWEKYLVSLPIRKKDVCTTLHMEVLLTSLVGLPIILLIEGIRFWHFTASEEGFFLGGYAMYYVMVYSVVYFATAAMTLLSETPVGQKSEQAVFLVGSLIGAVLAAGLSFGLDQITDSVVLIALLIVGISLVVFLISLFVLRYLYVKNDF